MSTPQARLAWLREHVYGPRGKTAIAKDLGIRLTTYIRYERDREIPPDMTARLIDRTGVNPVWLLRGAGDRFFQKKAAKTGIEDAVSLIVDLFGENDRLKEQLVNYAQGDPAEERIAESEEVAPYETAKGSGKTLWKLAAILRVEKRIKIRRVSDAPGPLGVYDGDEDEAELI